MANKARGVTFDEDYYSAFARKAWRLGLWAGLTLMAIVTAFLASQSEIGLRRVAAAGSAGATGEVAQSTPATARRLDLELEARRLAEAVRLLTVDRDRLLVRVATLERGFDDITGSNPPT